MPENFSPAQPSTRNVSTGAVAGSSHGAAEGSGVRTVQRLWPDPGEVDLDDLRAHYRQTWPSVDRGAVAMMITSLDGSAVLDGVSGGLSSPVDQALMDLTRSVADVVVVGAGTLRSEGYGGLRVSADSVAWRRRQAMSDHPVLAVVSASLNLTPDMAFLADAPVRPLILTGTDAPAEARRALGEVADVVVVGEGTGVDPAVAHRELAEHGHRRVLSEGGPGVLSRWFAADRVAELHLSVAGAMTGGDGQRIMHGLAASARRTELRHVLKDEHMLMLRHRVMFQEDSDPSPA